MTSPTQVNCHRHRQAQGAKDADRLRPKSATQSVVPSAARNTRTLQTAGVEAGTNSFVSPEANIVNPPFRPGFGAGASARGADGVAGRGDWKKRMPLGNRADRSAHIAPPCKRADIQLVVRDERAGRTFAGGNSK